MGGTTAPCSIPDPLLPHLPPCSLFGSVQQEAVQDADSVRLQQAAHQQHSCTLDECFQLYTKEEQVGAAKKPHALRCWGAGGDTHTHSFWGAHSMCPQLAPDDAWRCPHCRVPQQGTVQLRLWTLPDILIIHLKRFRQVAQHRHKLSTLVRFPLRGLDMAPHLAPGGGRWQHPLRPPRSCPPDALYDLYAVCNHHGSMQGGHYTGEQGVLWGTAVGCGAGGAPWGCAVGYGVGSGSLKGACRGHGLGLGLRCMRTVSGGGAWGWGAW